MKLLKLLEVESKDEIGVIVNSFNLMSEKLRIKDEQEDNNQSEFVVKIPNFNTLETTSH